MSTALYSHPECRLHDMGEGHPECPQRLDAINDRLLVSGLQDVLDMRDAPLVDIQALIRAHESRYVSELEDLLRRIAAGTESRYIDPDTVACPATWRAALRSAGAAVAATDAVIKGEVENAFCAVRPPGHHATRNQAMGFCFFNNVAVAARHAQDAHGAQRVAIVDWDVHHGNGTQDAFWRRDDVVYCSLHQWPLYPGSGAAGERGAGPGLGATINVPLPPGSGDDAYRRAFETTVLPAVAAARPGLLLVSAGYDAAATDPLASMAVTTAGFAAMARLARQAAEAACGGRMVALLEGGYDPGALARGVAATIRAWDAPGAAAEGMGSR